MSVMAEHMGASGHHDPSGVGVHYGLPWNGGVEVSFLWQNITVVLKKSHSAETNNPIFKYVIRDEEKKLYPGLGKFFRIIILRWLIIRRLLGEGLKHNNKMRESPSRIF